MERVKLSVFIFTVGIGPIAACTKMNPIYCDNTVPCRAVGEVCDYKKYTCVKGSTRDGAVNRDMQLSEDIEDILAGETGPDGSSDDSASVEASDGDFSVSAGDGPTDGALVPDVGCVGDADCDGDPDSADCAPANPAIRHGAVENCATAADDNCNGTANDEGAAGAKSYYADVDADTYGTGQAKLYCQPVAPYTATRAGDCNDASKPINPAQTEKCGNADDDNCNGAINEEGAEGSVEYFYDGDGDGFGKKDTPSMRLCASGQVAKYTAQQVGDCFDEEARAHPGQTEFFIEPVPGTTNYDYNCNGEHELQYGVVGCVGDLNTCHASNPAGYDSDIMIPNCGYSQHPALCVWELPGCVDYTPGTLPLLQQACH